MKRDVHDGFELDGFSLPRRRPKSPLAQGIHGVLVELLVDSLKTREHHDVAAVERFAEPLCVDLLDAGRRKTRSAWRRLRQRARAL